MFTCGLFFSASKAHSLTITARPVADIGGENAGCAPVLIKQGSMRVTQLLLVGIMGFAVGYAVRDTLSLWRRRKYVRNQD